MTLGSTITHAPAQTLPPFAAPGVTRATSTGPRRRRSLLVRPAVDLEVVIPALDEERRLPATLERALDYLGRQPFSSAVVVVDNGSTDATADRVRAQMGGPVPVHVVGCAAPGKGAAVRRGFATGRSRMVGFMDADLSTPVETLDRVVPLLRGGARSVIASRAVGDATRAVLDRCEVDGFSFDLELLARLHHAGHPIVEIPVVWTDSEGSTFSPLKHGMRSFADTYRIKRLMATAPARVRSIDLTDAVRPSAEGSALVHAR